MSPHYDDSQTERELREALAARAREIRPSSRLGAILDEASEPEPGTSHGRWLTGLAVAAAAAVVGGTIWAARPDSPTTLPGATPSTSATPTSTPSVSPSASPSTPRSTPPISAPPALAVYRAGSNGGVEDRPGLVREFWSAPAGTGLGDADRVAAAVAEAMRRSTLWSGVRLDAARVEASGISLDLSRPGSRAPDTEQAGLAVSSLVWTAQAAVGRGDLPVTFTTGSPGLLLDRLDPSRAFTRATTAPGALCDIWVDDPAPGAALRAASPVSVKGQAVAFEAHVQWELSRGGTVVRDGFTMTSIGAPSRGTFTVDLGRLETGTWTFRAFTTSLKDGTTVLAERVVTFSVR